jgi:hypothetical protein
VTGRLVAIVLLLAAGCGRGGAEPEDGPRTIGFDESEPYPITAIDYHFHDAHPSLPIGLDRAVRFINQGSNLHNVTFVGVDYAENVRPGEELVVDPIGSLVSGPGRYRFVCKFHADRGMEGVLVVEDDSAGT